MRARETKMVTDLEGTVSDLNATLKQLGIDLDNFNAAMIAKLGTFIDALTADDTGLLATLGPIFVAFGSDVVDASGELSNLIPAMDRFNTSVSSASDALDRLARVGGDFGRSSLPAQAAATATRSTPVLVQPVVNVTVQGSIAPLVQGIRATVEDQTRSTIIRAAQRVAL
jgi:hypothetical protein